METPIIPTPVSAPKTSMWTRVTAFVAKVTKTVVTKVKTVIKTVSAKNPVHKATFFAATLWHRALRPLLRGIIGGFALTGLIIGAVVAPVTTVLLLAVTAGLAFLLSRLVKSAEEVEHQSRFARFVLAAFDGIARVVLALAYTGAMVGVIAMSLTSLPFAAFTILAVGLAYFEVRGSMTIAFIAWCVFSGSWGLALLWTALFALRAPARYAARNVPEYSEIRRPSTVHGDVVRAHDAAPVVEVRPTDAPNRPETWTRGNHLRALGTEELWGTEYDKPMDLELVDLVAVDEAPHDVGSADHCGACGAKDGTMRVRSMNVPFVTGGTRKGSSKEELPRDWLCAACFAAECEDVALTLTGVSLEKRSVEVRLNKTGIEHSPEFSASTLDPTSFHWMEASWWRDRAGTQHTREWCCLVSGRVVATVVHDYRRKVFRASALGKVIPKGVKTAFSDACQAVQDELTDEAHAVERHIEAADAVAAEPQRRAKKT